MTESTLTILADMLRVDQGISGPAYDDRLREIVRASDAMIAREGAALDYSKPEDCQLCVMYASWLWGRRKTGEGMPRMLRFALNNRILAGRCKHGRGGLSDPDNL